MHHFISVRQRWLIDPVNAQSAQASTVLVTGVPQRYLTEAALTKVLFEDGKSDVAGNGGYYRAGKLDFETVEVGES